MTANTYVTESSFLHKNAVSGLRSDVLFICKIIKIVKIFYFKISSMPIFCGNKPSDS